MYVADICSCQNDSYTLKQTCKYCDKLMRFFQPFWERIGVVMKVNFRKKSMRCQGFQIQKPKGKSGITIYREKP